MIGYRVKYGSTSGNYTSSVDVGAALSTTLPDVPAGQSRFFVVVGYTAGGQESLPSNEIGYPVQLTVPDNQTVIQGTAVTLQATAVSPYDDGLLVFSLQSPPGGMTIDSATGVISWTVPAVPGQSAVPYTITVNVSDGFTTATGSFVLLDDKYVLTVTANGSSRAYGSANPAFTGTITGFVDGETLGTSDVSGQPLLTTSATSTDGVGSYAIVPTIGTLASSKYRFVFSNGSLTVTPRSLTVSADDATRPYGVANPVFTATIDGFVNGDTVAVVSGQPAFSVAAVIGSPVATYTITPSIGTLSAANYSFNSFVDGSLAVTPAALTITADSFTRVLGDANPVFTGHIDGLLNGDNITATFNTVANPASPVGSYSIDITMADPDGRLSNYTQTLVPGTLTVIPPAVSGTLTVVANNVSRVYGAPNPAFTASYFGFVNGDTASILSGAPAFSTSATDTSPVNTYNIAVSQGSLLAPGYAFGSFVDGTLTITPRTLAVTANNASRLYGAADPPLTANITGFVNGDTVAVVSGQAGLSTTATATSPAGTYPITPSVGTLSAANYTFGNFVNGSFVVNPVPLTVTANDATRVYGASDPVFSVAFTGFVNGETSAVVGGVAGFTTSATTSSPVGTYPLTPNAGALNALNYTFSTFVDGSYSITPATLTITADSLSRLVGDSNPVLTGQITGLQNADNITATFSTTATPGSPAGSYDIDVTLNDPDGRLPNYVVTIVKGTLTVTNPGGPATPGVLTVTANNASRVYGTANPVFTASFSGFVNGDTASIVSGQADLTTSATITSPAGTYPIVAGLGTLTAPNYTFGAFNNGTLTVTPAPLTVTANSFTRFVGDPNPSFTGQINGIQNGDNITAIYSTTATPASPAGNYDITITLVDPDGHLPSYAVTTVKGVLTINTPVGPPTGTLTVTANGASRAYGAPNPVFSATYSGFNPGDDASVVNGQPALSTVAVAGSPVGTYPITVGLGTLSAANYIFGNFVDGTLTVTPKTLAVSANSVSRPYGSVTPTLTANFLGFVNGDTAAAVSGQASLASTATATSPVGTYPISVGAGTLSAVNYTFGNFIDGTVTVTPAPLIVTANYVTRFIGDPNPPLTGNIVGLKNGDNITAIFSTTATIGSPVGSYDIDVILQDPDGHLPNYSVTIVKGVLSVLNTGALAVTANNFTRQYGDNNPVFTANYSGFVNGDTASVVTGHPDFSTTATATTPVGTYPIVVSQGTLSAANYAFGNFVNGTLTITPRVLTVRATSATRMYGASDPVFTPIITGFVNGDSASVVGGRAVLTTPATAATIPGTYPIKVSAGDMSAANYTFGSFIDGTLTITPAPLTVAASNQVRPYGSANQVFTPVFSGLLNGDSPALVISGQPAFSTTATSGSPVGSYPLSISAGTLTSARYTFTGFVNGTLTVTPAPLTITAASASRFYGSANPVLTAAISGFVNGDSASVVSGQADVTTAATTSSPVGGYSVVPAPGNLVAANYTFANFVNGTLTVKPVTLTVSADHTNRVYGAANPAPTATITGFVNGETAATVVHGQPFFFQMATLQSPVGNYPIVVAQGSLSAPNYIFGSFVSDVLTVTPAPLTVTVNNASRLVGELNPVFTGRLGGLRNDDVITLTFDTSATTNSLPGVYEIRYHLVDPQNRLGNYAVASVPGVLTVSGSPNVGGPLEIPAANVGVNNNGFFGLTLPSQPHVTYTLQGANSLTNPVWVDLTTVIGDGSVITLSDTSPATLTARFYRVVINKP